MRWFFWKELRETARQIAGRRGEKAAERFLKKEGYKILGRRVRVGPRDELDLVVRRDEVLVFVEVKTRDSEEYGSPMSAVGRTKQKALSRAAVGYLQKLKEKPPFVRFDVVEVIGAPDGDPEIRHYENAVNIDDRYRLRW